MFTPDSPGGTSTGLLSADVGTVTQDRRTSRRRDRRINLTLTGLGSTDSFACTTDDISEGGVYVRLPADVGLAVGKRVEVQFGNDVQSAKPASFSGESCFATVVRTQLHTQEPKPMIGAGLRFDQPLFL